MYQVSSRDYAFPENIIYTYYWQVCLMYLLWILFPILTGDNWIHRQLNDL